MKKKLLENDIFYLSLFVCVCLVAIGGIWLTNKNVNKLASNNVVEDNKEIHLIDNDNEEDAIATTTESEENLSKAKENQEKENKLSFLGTEVIREYSETEPSYSNTLNVWEIHKGIDVSVSENQEIKSLMDGKVLDVYEDDEYGMSVKIKSDNITVVYSNLDENVKVEKNQEIKEGDCIGLAGNTTRVECKDENHVHVEAYEGENSIDPMSLVN